MSSSMDLRYPVGKFQLVPYSDKERDSLLSDILFLPRKIEYSIVNLDEAQLATPYREGGWTVKQVIHHVADSHMNAYIRFKLGLTEDQPTIKPYNEEKWSMLCDVENVPVNISLTLLHALHTRWYDLLKHFEPGEWERTVVHPQHNKVMTLWELLGSYAWHGRHHTAHITSLRDRMGW